MTLFFALGGLGGSMSVLMQVPGVGVGGRWWTCERRGRVGLVASHLHSHHPLVAAPAAPLPPLLLVLSLLPMQGKSLWSSSHFTTAVIGLILLALQGMTSAFFEVGGQRGGRRWLPVLRWRRKRRQPAFRGGLVGSLGVGGDGDGGLRFSAPLACAAACIPFVQDDPSARGIHAYLGSAILALFLYHGTLGLQLGLSL